MVKATNKIKELATQLDAITEKAAFVLTGQVLADCNKYVRYAEGDLYQSSLTASDIKNGKLSWDTPYALEVYYTGTPNTARNPEASLMWCQKATDNHSEEWATILGNALKKEINR